MGSPSGASHPRSDSDRPGLVRPRVGTVHAMGLDPQAPGISSPACCSLHPTLPSTGIHRLKAGPLKTVVLQRVPCRAGHTETRLSRSRMLLYPLITLCLRSWQFKDTIPTFILLYPGNAGFFGKKNQKIGKHFGNLGLN